MNGAVDANVPVSEPPLHVVIRRLTIAALGAGVVGILYLKLRLLNTQNINWDEFVFLSSFYEFQRGELTSTFQTFQVHLIGWIASVADSAVDQVMAGRMQAFVLRIGTCMGLFLIGRRLYGSAGALISLIAGLSFSFVMGHGESFRADPIITFLAVSAAALVICGPRKPWAAAIAGVSMGLAGAISLKSVIFLPAILGPLLAELLIARERHAAVRSFAVVALTGCLTFATLLAWQSSVLRAPPQVGVIGSQAAGIAKAMWFDSQPQVLNATLSWDHAFWAALMFGLVLAVHQLFAGPSERRQRSLILLSCALPLASILVYRNAFPYFYICVVPLAALSCGLLVAEFEARLRSYPFIVALCTVTLMLPFVSNAWLFAKYNSEDGVRAQRALLKGIDEIFPEPTTYIDRCSMVSNYRKVGLFMSTHILGLYQRAGTPIMEKIVRSQKPRFVLVNSPGLDLGQPYVLTRLSPYWLLQEDFEFLAHNFVPHWGPIWVLGKRFDLIGGRDEPFEIAVAGMYTVESGSPVLIDGTHRNAGDVIELTEGEHTLRTEAGAAVVTLRIGSHLTVPAEAPPRVNSLFKGLGFRRP